MLLHLLAPQRPKALAAASSSSASRLLIFSLAFTDSVMAVPSLFPSGSLGGSARGCACAPLPATVGDWFVLTTASRIIVRHRILTAVTFSSLVRQLSTEPHARGHQFERLCCWHLQNAPEYRHGLEGVWLWSEWPGRCGYPECDR